MILDFLENFGRYGDFHGGVTYACDYLRRMGQAALIGLESGTFRLDNGIAVLVKPFESKPPAELVWEAHRHHIDMQYMLFGHEDIGIADFSAMELIEEAEGKDKVLLRGDGMFMRFSAGQCIVLYPNDAHMPCAAIRQAGTSCKKIVFKIPLNW